MTNVDLSKLTKAELRTHLRQLERELRAKSRFEYAGLIKGSLASFYVLIGTLATLAVGTFAFIKRGTGFIDGTHIVILVFILVGGLIIYFSFVFGRTARIRAEISKTKKYIEMSSGDRV